MALGSREEQSRGISVIPDPKGTGNVLYLSELPFYKEMTGNEKFNTIAFPFYEESETETEVKYEYRIIEFISGTDEQNDRGIARFLHMYGALMTDENYKVLKQVDETTMSIQQIVDYANSLVAEDIFGEQLTVMIGYTDRSGKYISSPKAGDIISSKYKKRTLRFTPKSKLFLTASNKAVNPDSEDDDDDDMK